MDRVRPERAEPLSPRAALAPVSSMWACVEHVRAKLTISERRAWPARSVSTARGEPQGAAGKRRRRGTDGRHHRARTRVRATRLPQDHRAPAGCGLGGERQAGGAHLATRLRRIRKGPSGGFPRQSSRCQPSRRGNAASGSPTGPRVRLRPERANHAWACDLVEDRTHDGRKVRMARTS